MTTSVHDFLCFSLLVRMHRWWWQVNVVSLSLSYTHTHHYFSTYFFSFEENESSLLLWSKISHFSSYIQTRGFHFRSLIHSQNRYNWSWGCLFFSLGQIILCWKNDWQLRLQNQLTANNLLSNFLRLVGNENDWVEN